MLHHGKEGIDGAAPPDGVAIVRQCRDVWEYAVDKKRHEAVVVRALCVEGHGILVVSPEAVELQHRTREDEVGLVLTGPLHAHREVLGVGGGDAIPDFRAIAACLMNRSS
jgi:hypothetical protein